MYLDLAFIDVGQCKAFGFSKHATQAEALLDSQEEDLLKCPLGVAFVCHKT